MFQKPFGKGKRPVTLSYKPSVTRLLSVLDKRPEDMGCLVISFNVFNLNSFRIVDAVVSLSGSCRGLYRNSNLDKKQNFLNTNRSVFSKRT